MDVGKPRFWNIWWTLMVLSASFTIVVLVLEGLGVFRDLGLVLSGIGVILTLVFGFGASARTFLVEFRGDVVPRLDGLRATVLELDRNGEGTNRRLDNLQAAALETNARLDRVIALLDERLPRPSASPPTLYFPQRAS
jgi:hypothetical protein